MAEDSKDLLIDILDTPKTDVVQEKKTRKPRKKPEPRKLADVAKEVRKLRDEGIPVPVIADRLEMSYQVVNQLVLRSYKMVSNTVEVFEKQERQRLGL
jgi:hypothetical protein